MLDFKTLPRYITAMGNGLEKRFWKKVKVAGEDECWLWTASVAGRGYGQIKAPKTRHQIYAHRYSYELHEGPIPDGVGVLHSCDNPRCVNPKHLFLGTSGDNAADMKSKGRHLYGELNAQSVLTTAQVRRIHDLLESGDSESSVASVAGVSRVTIHRIKHGLRWNHIWQERHGFSETV
jgi:hypothetical protein